MFNDSLPFLSIVIVELMVEVVEVVVVVVVVVLYLSPTTMHGLGSPVRTVPHPSLLRNIQ